MKIDPVTTEQSEHEQKNPDEDLEPDNDEPEDSGDLFHRI
jgi:hypothetical protein